ncbi:unnamed protein product [Rangifer tarandus platyrhynchus]|uniref:Basic proline-rich protein-like n=1 Tax=Rangifer tarandus platyrhynchus TaxID=3082113 RepID=A0ABN8YV23_RANTA|nr:unnamed protein product [Rangifer tarandus platyrhynchus]
MQTGLEAAETPTPKSTPPSAPGRGGRGRTQQLRQGDSPDPSLLAFHALGGRQRVRRECSPDPPRAKSPLSRRDREEAKMHLSPPGPESGAGRRRPGRAGEVGAGGGGPRLAPPGARARLPSGVPLWKVAESPNQNKRRRLALRADRAAVSLGRRKKHVTEPPRSAARPPPPGGSRPGLYIPGRARPAPAPLRPPAVPQRRRRPASAPRSGSAPMRPAARAQSRPPRATQGAPGPQESPPRARAGVFGCLPESTRGVWENGGGGRAREDAGVRVGGDGGALRLLGPAWEGPSRGGLESWAGSYLTGDPPQSPALKHCPMLATVEALGMRWAGRTRWAAEEPAWA